MKIQNFILKVKGRKIFCFFLVLFTFNFLLLTLPFPVYAVCIDPNKGVNIGDCFGFGNIKSFGDGASRLVKPGFSIATTLVIIYFLFGAFKFLVSGGDKEQVAAGRNIITHAIIGFILLMLIFVVMQFLLSQLFGINNFLII